MVDLARRGGRLTLEEGGKGRTIGKGAALSRKLNGVA